MKPWTPEEASLGRIYLVRHGQTAWNRARIFRGRRDVRLNETGRREAQCAAEALRDVPFACFYTSPLLRARHTAEIIADGRNVPVASDRAFIDLDYGEWTEFWDAEARAKFKDLYRLWEKSPHLVRFPGGETLDEARKRSVTRLFEIAERHAQETICLVSHRVILKLLLCEANGLPTSAFWDVQLDTGAISVLDFEGRCPRVILENDCRHLKSLHEHESADF
jgi:broad specificity phosphatase PhoE